jgi:hypothetical protein
MEEREQLVRRLVREFGLREVAAAACAHHGIPDHAEAVAYCLVVLMRKADPARTNPKTGEKELPYNLGPDDPGFAERLSGWADAVAHNLAQWASTYSAIQAEADGYDISTLRTLIRTDRGEDLIDQIADHAAAVLGDAARLEQMTLARLIEYEPAGNEYAFQTPLSQWLRTISLRTLGKLVGSIPPCAEGGSVPDDAEQAEADAERAYRELIAIVSELAETRELLADALEHAERYEESLVARRPPTRDAARALAAVRAELAYVTDALAAEHRAVPGMLAYIVLSMRTSPQLQCVSVLSLRLATIEPVVVETLTNRMHAILEDELEPKPVLVNATRAAAAAGDVPKSRASALETLRGAPEQRRALLAPAAERLDRLPPSVPDIPSIAPPANATYAVVKQQRSVAHKELESVNELYGRTFWRYAIRKHEHER